MQLFVFESPKKIWDFAIKRWEDISEYSISMKGKFTVALSGGNTPEGFYRALSKRKDLPWDKTHIFQVDEKFIPHLSNESNYRLIKSCLLDPLELKKRQVHTINIGAKSSHNAALDYDSHIRKFFKLASTGLPEFDLVYLGIGEDGHTASLFPGDKALEERKRIALSVSSGDIKFERVTLTLPVLNRSRNAIFIVTGSNKREVIRKLMDKSASTLPAAMVVPQSGSAEILIDQDADGLS